MVWVGQFGIADGQALEETPWVGLYPDPHPDRDLASDLYLIVDPALPGSEEFVGEMKDAIGDMFHETKFTVTGGILRALRSAHENLMDWNKRSLKEHRVAAGISCVAVQDDEAFVAQVGPARAVYLHGGEIEAVEPGVIDAKEPFGLEEDFYPEFRRFELGSGDRLLLFSPTLAEPLGGPELAATLSLAGEQALPALYEKAKGIENCGAILIAAAPAEAE